PECLRARACVADEERAGDGGDGEGEGGLVPVARLDQRDRAEDEALGDSVGGRVDEGAEGRRLTARAGERPVEDVEERADDEDGGRPGGGGRSRPPRPRARSRRGRRARSGWPTLSPRTRPRPATAARASSTTSGGRRTPG